jgi:putative membrane protein
MDLTSTIGAFNIHAQGGWGYGMGPGMMGGYGYGMGYGFVWTILVAIVIAAVVIGVVFLIRGAVTGPRAHGGTTSGDEAMDILRRRFANGEIDKEEFEERKRALKS